MKKSKAFLLVISLAILPFLMLSCTEDDSDPCDATAEATKILNLQANVTIMSLDGVPVVGEAVQFYIKLIKCDGTENQVDYDNFTDDNGMIETEVTNFVMDNSIDKIEVYAVAPYLQNFVGQNFDIVTKKYNEFTGLAQEDIVLNIYTQAENQ